MTLTVYTDISFHPEHRVFGWAWVAINAEGKIHGRLWKGARRAETHHVDLEDLPKKLARKRLGWAILVFKSDYPQPGETYVGKLSQDPLHLLVHYAAGHAAQRLALKARAE